MWLEVIHKIEDKIQRPLVLERDLDVVDDDPGFHSGSGSGVGSGVGARARKNVMHHPSPLITFQVVLLCVISSNGRALKRSGATICTFTVIIRSAPSTSQGTSP